MAQDPLDPRPRPSPHVSWTLVLEQRLTDRLGQEAAYMFSRDGEGGVWLADSNQRQCQDDHFSCCWLGGIRGLRPWRVVAGPGRRAVGRAWGWSGRGCSASQLTPRPGAYGVSSWVGPSLPAQSPTLGTGTMTLGRVDVARIK